MGLNFADIFETVVATVPDKEALVVRATNGPELRLTFGELDGRANQLAHELAALGVGIGDHVGCHLYDGNQYVETTLAAFKLRAVPVNVNFRYVDEELAYLFDNADLKAVVTEPDLEDRASRAAAGLGWSCPVLVADDRYEAALRARATSVARRRPPFGRRPLRAVDRRAPRACPRASCGVTRTSTCPPWAVAAIRPWASIRSRTSTTSPPGPPRRRPSR